MAKGTVKFYNETKSFGFIVDQDTKEEIFVHSSGLIDEIRKDDKVSFKTIQGKKGINAIEVKKI